MFETDLFYDFILLEGERVSIYHKGGTLEGRILRVHIDHVDISTRSGVEILYYKDIDSVQVINTPYFYIVRPLSPEEFYQGVLQDDGS